LFGRIDAYQSCDEAAVPAVVAHPNGQHVVFLEQGAGGFVDALIAKFVLPDLVAVQVGFVAIIEIAQQHVGVGRQTCGVQLKMQRSHATPSRSG
jgi:hypothetical protein